MLNWTFAAAGATLLLVLLAAFEAVPAPVPAGIAAAGLGGITVRSDRFPSGIATFKNGEYHGPAVPGSAGAAVVKLTDCFASGTVNGRDAAAVVIVTDPGGSGTFYDLALLIKKEGRWVNADTLFLGDRVKVHSLDIRESGILLRMTTHGPGDPSCCPTQETTRRFEIHADRLVSREGETAAAIGMHEIVGPLWHWVRTRYADDTTQRPAPGASGYTVQLKHDGTVQVRGDCNVSGGSFTLKNADLAITISHSTMAACPAGSLEDVFIRDLNRTGGFRLENGVLLLDLRSVSGTMDFHKGPSYDR